MDIDQPLENFLKPAAPSPRPLFTLTLSHPEALGRLWGYLSQFCSDFSLDISPQQTPNVTELLSALKPFFRRQEAVSSRNGAVTRAEGAIKAPVAVRETGRSRALVRAHFLFQPAVKVLLRFGPQPSDWSDENLSSLILWAGSSQVFRWKDARAGQALLDSSVFDPTQVRIKGFLQLLGISFEVQA